MRAIASVGLILALAAASALAQDHCSLIVHVVNANGFKPSGVPVKLVESNGRAAFGTTIEGEVKFCALGVSAVGLTIGGDCNQVLVRNIPLTWGLARVVNVVYDREACLVDSPVRPGCYALLRFVNERGEPISEVQVDPPLGRSLKTRSDVYGRSMAHVPPGEKLSVSAHAPGYSSRKIDLTCAENDTREMMITLLREAK